MSTAASRKKSAITSDTEFFRVPTIGTFRALSGGYYPLSQQRQQTRLIQHRTFNDSALSSFDPASSPATT